MKNRITFLMAFFFCSFLAVSTYAQIPHVYDKENTGKDIVRKNGATKLPKLRDCMFMVGLPDPFAWTADPLGVSPARSTSFDDWAEHRQEIMDMIQHYEIGEKPYVDLETQVTATVTGTTGNNRTLNVTITVEGQSLTMTSAFVFPTGNGPFPVSIGFGGAGSTYGQSGIATAAFTNSQLSPDGSHDNSNPFYTLYPELNVDNQGQYAIWNWGVSRIIDGLYKLKNTDGYADLNGKLVDLKGIMVNGCSRYGKAALFAGAFDERIAFTFAVESGGGGATSWRASMMSAVSVEGLAQTNSQWFKNSMFTFGGPSTWRIPTDHHLLAALCAPRALVVSGNYSQTWLSSASCYVNSRATKKVYQTLGIDERFGYIITTGHGHCSTPSKEQMGPDSITYNDALGHFINKYVKRQDIAAKTLNVCTAIAGDYEDPNFYYNPVNADTWTAWWGTGSPNSPRPHGTEGVDEVPIFNGNNTQDIFRVKAGPTPTIDGNIAGDLAWSNVSWVDLDEEKSTSTTHNTTARFKSIYTKDSLYFAVQVKDNTPFLTTPNNTYERDCIEIFLALDTTTRTGSSGNTQYRLTRGGDYAVGGGAAVAGVRTAVISGAEEWTAEFAFPWAGIAAVARPVAITGYSELEGLASYPFIRFEMAVADNTTGQPGAGRSQQLFWNKATDDQYSTMANLGFIQFMGDQPEYIGTNMVMDISRLPSNPTIDGAVEDAAWASKPWIDVYRSSAATSTRDMIPRFKVGYTQDSIYFAVDVIDATPVVGNDHTVDCVEIFLNTDTTTRSTSGSNQFRLGRNGYESGGSGNATLMNTAAIATDEKWNGEFAIPWVGLAAKSNATTPPDQRFTNLRDKTHNLVRFEIAFADNSTPAGATANRGRTQQAFWNAATDDQYNGMTNMGYLRLENLDVSIANIDGKSKAAYYSISDDALIVGEYAGEISVYDVSGVLVLKATVNNGEASMSALNKGVYMVSVPGYPTVKFIK